MSYQKIEETIEKQIRPFLNSHGGDITFLGYENGVVTVSLSGACSGCPSADISTRYFIEEKLREEMPEIVRVEIEQVTDPELLAFARKILKIDWIFTSFSSSRAEVFIIHERFTFT